MINILKVNIEDAYELSLIEEECFSMPWSMKALEESIQQDMYIFLKAVLDDDIVGYISLYRSFDEGDMVNLAVRKLYRGKGIASLLLKELIKACHQIDVQRILLEVRKSNDIAISLYKKIGFVEIATRKNFYEKPVEDGIIMELKVMEAISTIY